MTNDAAALNRLRHPAILWVLWGFGVLWLLRSVILPAPGKFAAIERQKTEEIQRREVLRRVVSLETQTAAYSGHLNAEQSVYSLIKAVDQKAQKTGVSLNSAIPSGTETVAGLKKTLLRLDAVCNYHQLGRFASEIENSQVLIRIDSVHAERVMSGVKNVQGLRVTLELSIFSKAG